MDPRFEWVGGATALDFHNTVTWAGEQLTQERLASYPDLVAWGRAAGLLSARAATQLLRGAKARPDRARQSLARAHQFRAALHQVLIAAAAGTLPARGAVAQLNEVLQEAFKRLEIDVARGEWNWGWTAADNDLSRVLWPVAWSASTLLTSGEREQLKACAASDCGWVFLDRSRNHARRWCDMKSCGNVAKARRFYAKTRAQDPT